MIGDMKHILYPRMGKRLVALQAFAHERRARPAGFICVNDPDLKLRFDHPDQKCERDSVFGTGVVIPFPKLSNTTTFESG